MKALKRTVAFVLSLLLCTTGFPTQALATMLDALPAEVTNEILIEYRTSTSTDGSTLSGEEGWTAYGSQDTPLAAENESLSSVEIRLKNGGRGVQYAVRDAWGAWTDEPWFEDGACATAEGGITGIAIRLTPELANLYDVWYADPSSSAPSIVWAHNGEELVSETDGPLNNLAVVVTPKESEATQQEPTSEGTDNATDDATDTNGDEAEASTSTEETSDQASHVPFSHPSRPVAEPLVRTSNVATISPQGDAAAQTAREMVQTTAATTPRVAPVTQLSTQSVSPAPNTTAVNASSTPAPATVAITSVETPLSQVVTSPAAGTEAAAQANEGLPILTAASDDTIALSAAATSWHRLGGANRYETMEHIAAETFPSNKWAIIATGGNYPDALAASALAGTKKCPIILTKQTELTPQAKVMLEGLGVKHAFVMGGTGAIDDATELAIADLGIATARVAGSNRVGTSVEALKAVRSSGSKAHTVIIAAGNKYPDTLSIGPWAYSTASPIVLTKADGTLSTEAVAAIKDDKNIDKVLIVGGTAVVSNEVKEQLGDDYDYERLGGRDRYDTSKLIAEWELKHGFSWAKPSIASGTNYPDALAGAPLAGKQKSPILLASGPKSTTISFLYANKKEVDGGYLLGGSSAVSFNDPIQAYETADLQLNGVDISGHNVPINTGTLEADFVIIKATEGYDGTVWNPDYTKMADQALASGKLIGFYHYANGKDAIKEADVFYEAIQDYQGRALACLDWEGQNNGIFNTGVDVLWCRTFLDHLKELYGGTPFIYTSKNVTNSHDWTSVAQLYPLWGAQYASNNPVYGYNPNPWQSDAGWGAWGSRPTIFQYSGNGRLEHNGGTSSSLDLNLFYGKRSNWEAYLK